MGLRAYPRPRTLPTRQSFESQASEEERLVAAVPSRWGRFLRSLQHDDPRPQRELRFWPSLGAREEVVAHRKDKHRTGWVRRVVTVRELSADGVTLAAFGQILETRAVAGEILQEEAIVVGHRKVSGRGTRQRDVVDGVEAKLGQAGIQAQAHIGGVAGLGAG